MVWVSTSKETIEKRCKHSQEFTKNKKTFKQKQTLHHFTAPQKKHSKTQQPKNTFKQKQTSKQPKNTPTPPLTTQKNVYIFSFSSHLLGTCRPAHTTEAGSTNHRLGGLCINFLSGLDVQMRQTVGLEPETFVFNMDSINSISKYTVYLNIYIYIYIYIVKKHFFSPAPKTTGTLRSPTPAGRERDATGVGIGYMSLADIAWKIKPLSWHPLSWHPWRFSPATRFPSVDTIFYWCTLSRPT